MPKLLAPAVLLLTLLSGCVHVKMDPLKIDATITVKLERELEDFFNDIDTVSDTTVVPDDNTQAR